MHRIILGISFAILVLITSFHLSASVPNSPPKWMTRNILAVGWCTGWPVGRTFADIDTISAYGATVDYQLRINSKYSLGPNVQWQLFERKSYQKLQTDASTSETSVVTWSEKRFAVVSFSVRRYFFKRETMLPYIGMSVGAAHISPRQNRIWRNSEVQSWHLQTSPEVGLILLHGRIPFWLFTQFKWIAPNSEQQGETYFGMGMGIAVPN